MVQGQNKKPDLILEENVRKFGPLKHKCGYEKCEFKSDSKDKLFDHLESVHHIKRKPKPIEKPAAKGM
jgi:hypothetical protein